MMPIDHSEFLGSRPAELTPEHRERLQRGDRILMALALVSSVGLVLWAAYVLWRLW